MYILLGVLIAIYVIQLLVLFIRTAMEEITTKEEFHYHLIPFYWAYSMYNDLD